MDLRPAEVSAIIKREIENYQDTVKMESVKRPGEVKRHEEKIKSTDKRRKRPTLRKIPQRREYRR